MLSTQLHEAGFFPIKWQSTASDTTEGTTYVRPDSYEVLRVFVPTVGGQIELYGGSLLAGTLRYRGPVQSEEELLGLLNSSKRYLAA